MKCVVAILLGISIIAVFVMCPPQLSQAEEKAAIRPPMPIYISPFYDSKGPRIHVGKFSESLARADAKSIDEVMAELKKEKVHLRAEVMYVAAIRLYDLGRKDEAVYWFYSAQYRARLFNAILDAAHVGSIGDEAFELKQAYGAFNQLAGTYINGYAFGDLKKLEATLMSVAKEGDGLSKMEELYPTIRFIAKNKWDKKNGIVAKGLTDLVDYIKNNADSIKRQRKQNEVEGKY